MTEWLTIGPEAGKTAHQAGKVGHHTSDMSEVCPMSSDMRDDPPIFELCERCGSEGRIYVCDGRDHDGSPRERDLGECPDCNGEGLLCMPGIPRTEWDDLEMFDYFDGAFEALLPTPEDGK